MRHLKQIVKIIATPSELRAMCVGIKGSTLAFGIDLKDKPEVKKLVDDFSSKLLEALEKEVG